MVGLFAGDDGAGLMLVLCFYASEARRELSIPIGCGCLFASVLQSLGVSHENQNMKMRTARDCK